MNGSISGLGKTNALEATCEKVVRVLVTAFEIVEGNLHRVVLRKL